MTEYKAPTFYEPMRTVTTTSTWSGWQIVNPKCYGCFHSCVMYGRLVCCCASRTVEHGVYGDTCKSYLGRKVDE